MEKKHYIIIGVIVAIIVIWYFFLRKKKPGVGQAESSWTSAGSKFYRLNKDSSGKYVAGPLVRVNPTINPVNSVYGSCMSACTGSYSQSFCEGWCGPFKGMGEGGMEDENVKRAKTHFAKVFAKSTN